MAIPPTRGTAVACFLRTPSGWSRKPNLPRPSRTIGVRTKDIRTDRTPSVSIRYKNYSSSLGLLAWQREYLLGPSDADLVPLRATPKSQSFSLLYLELERHLKPGEIGLVRTSTVTRHKYWYVRRDSLISSMETSTLSAIVSREHYHF